MVVYVLQGVIIFTIIMVIILVGMFVVEVITDKLRDRKQRKRDEATIKENNPEGFKVGDMVYSNALIRRPYKITEVIERHARVDGWLVRYDTLTHHRKIYMGGE